MTGSGCSMTVWLELEMAAESTRYVAVTMVWEGAWAQTRLIDSGGTPDINSEAVAVWFLAKLQFATA